MDKLLITGGNKLRGEVHISKAKNSCLPIMAGVLLSNDHVTLNDLPDLRDINTLIRLLEGLGVQTTKENNQTTFKTNNITSYEANYDLVKTMRASILVLGPLLARFGEAKVSLPGGCAIGSRPIDIHLDALKKLGAEINIENGYVIASCSKLKGSKVVLSFPSVGATENIMMAACLAEGKTIIENVAREPEIVDLANFLRSMGAKITGDGTSVIEIEGVEQLSSTNYTPIPDRVETATFVMAGLMTGGRIHIKSCVPDHIDSVLDVIKKMGGKVECSESEIIVTGNIDEMKSCQVDTAPYPGFPTDVQAQLIALATMTSGTSVVTEHIFENRFMHVPELNRMGAEIVLKGPSAIISGVDKLTAAPVMCTDLRASAALVLAALAAQGESEITRIYHLDRGYEKIDQKLRDLGANLKRVND